MTFNPKDITTLGGQHKRGLQSLGYVSTDSLATVSAAGYFNEYREYITKGDVITFINTANNTIAELRVTVLGISGDVETVVLSATEQEVKSVKNVTNTYAILATDFMIICDGTFTVTLPALFDVLGRQYIIKNVGAETITVDSSSTIDDETTQTLSPNDGMDVIATPEGWLIT